MSKSKSLANNAATTKKPHRWQKGQSGNPKGAPKRGQSWAELIKQCGDMTPPEAAERSIELAKQLLKVGDGITLKEAVVLRVYGALLFEPQPGLLNALMDRAEGKVSQPITVDWREEAKQNGYDPDELVRRFAATLDSGDVARGAEFTDADETRPD